MGFPEKIKNIVYESNRLCTRVRCILFDGKLVNGRKRTFLTASYFSVTILTN